MRIGIITPAFNAAETLSETIRSVLGQTYQDWRMVIVDDGSRDRTADVASDFSDPRISVLRQPNQGVSVARNRGMQAVSGDAYLFLDADDRLAPEALTKLVATLDESPWASAAVGPYQFIDGTGPARRVQPARGGDLVEALLLRNRFVNGGQILVRREAIDLAGGFDPALRYGEDWELWVRLALTGEFAATRRRDPVLYVRQRTDGTYARAAADPASFEPCISAIFRNPAVSERVGSGRIGLLERAAKAENAWVVGREMIRHCRTSEGLGWLSTSVRLWPTLRRLALLAAVPIVLRLPQALRGALRPYAGQAPAVR